MTPVALIFPGQGAQKVGMGKEFYDASTPAKAIFDQAESILKNDLKSAIFDGPQEKLTQTAYCQPAILTFSIAALKAFEAHPQFKKFSVMFSAGLSLGEYSALVAAGALPFADALRLVERRSALMEEATKLAPGKMAAIIGFDKGKLKGICAATGAEVANYNSPEQIVITGQAAKVEAACRMIAEAGAKTVIPLDVSGAFHSSLMKPAAEKFQLELQKYSFHSARFPIVSNVDAAGHTSGESIQKNLGQQITSSVQWEDSVKYMAGQGVSHFIELGPGKVLKGLIRKIDPNLKVFNVEKPADLEQFSAV